MAVSSMGQIGGVLGYALTAGPAWFYCTLVVLATPYFVIYRFPTFHPSMQSLFWKALFVYTIMNSAIELFVWTGGTSHHHHTMGQSKLSWLLGNTTFGIVGWIGLPVFFSLQQRVRHDTIDVVEDITVLNSLPTSPSGYTPNLSPSFSNSKFDDPATSGFNSPVAGMASKMALPSGLALLSVLLITVCTYFPMQKLPPRGHSIDMYWSIAYILSPVLICWLLFHSRESSQGGDFNLVVIFSAVLIHIPIFVGHLCLALFSIVDHAPKLAISCLFLVVMQAYFYVLTKVIQGFAAPFTHPSLLYGGQLYFYIFWYLLVGSDSPLDGLYFAMLALSNLHVVLANTGIYTDIHSVTVSCCLDPRVQLFSMCVGSSVAVCFRASQPSQSLSSVDDIDVVVSNDSMIMSPSNRACRFSVKQRRSFDTDHTKKEEELQQLYFLMKLAEQDHMADTSALILVPSLISWLSWMEGKVDASNLFNMWLRCFIMFGARVAGSFLAREIFAYKMVKNSAGSGGMSGVDRVRVQRIMLADFRRQFWYLAAVTTVVAFACFDKAGWPARYAFYST
ncbi:hypothetical protein LEN26_012731 [Aphanomyces euteiches]|uniref:Transmembrane protein n=1 Tax=Aphanomyces euteiches TaxID=100861 RepID=A0A6G0WYD4_9STRA|nr:hypothetical protein Ae201684_010271 [Aphanomyces euteiches]KAH9102638.1 hypothetical protein AeMF1_020810 [Aphanomyces euteiches]KAH9117331.1 hypothetical protein LEN26_012731 [Aphanomyces euteiches]KAH9132597.1 hypothetical protein AeRB84_021055 [Aphanomyces euteiches]KAH9186099.1 hypothetical protein AeNC1_011925 [Aphanomyces euteiches]